MNVDQTKDDDTRESRSTSGFFLLLTAGSDLRSSAPIRGKTSVFPVDSTARRHYSRGTDSPVLAPEGTPMSLQLLVTAGPDAGQTFTVQAGPDLTLGRGEHSYYRLNDPRTSRCHCQLVLEGDQVSVIDNGSTALKVLLPEFSKVDEEVQRFVRAMKTAMPLRHPNLVAVLGAGKAGPYCWEAMEYVCGESMTEVIGRIGVAGMLDWKYAFRMAVHVGRALAYAHGQDIIHRNVRS